MSDTRGMLLTGLWPGLRAAVRAVALFLVVALFSSCLAPLGIYKYGKSAPKKGHLIQDVPFEKWLSRNFCGPACLAMVLNYWDGIRPFSQQRIAADIYDSENQLTYNSELVLYPRTLGFMSYSFQGDLQTLKEVVGKDIPLIVLTKPILQVAKGHYRVVIGFDDAKSQVIFHDPYFGERYAMSSSDFLKLWGLGKGMNEFRWAMAVVPAGRAFPFPALANHAVTAVNLATAYYRRADYANSREQWLKATELMSGDPYPLFSLGMVSLRMGNAGEAESYALEALKLDGKSAYALDVLGLAYAEQGKIPEALEALARAVKLAPDKKFIRDHYLQVRALQEPKPGLEITPEKKNSIEKKR
jgi:tetratricopeptide (TPR) repeat protein